MTAEIAILNRNAIALAADSAVTIGRQRAWKNANKLFSLSPTNDIGIMIYGSGEFNGCSWEIIAKTFRECIGSHVFDTVSECGEEFISYLGSGKFNDLNSMNANVRNLIFDAVKDIKKEIDGINRKSGENLSKREHSRMLRKIIINRINLIGNNFDKLNLFIDKSSFSHIYLESIINLTKRVFEYPLTRKLTELLLDLLHLVLCSKIKSSLSTGVVVAGYGKSQLYPELIEYCVDGQCCESIRTWISREVNLNVKRTATIIPFAQSDMFQLFMEGISNNHLRFIQQALSILLEDKSTSIIDKFVADHSNKATEMELQRRDNQTIMQGLFNAFSSYINKEMIQPVVQVVSTLPKEEMAAMAEALVEITTLRRKMDSTIESVGGPTDVAIISKGDGFVWVKRKYYFDIALNPDFLKRRRFRHGGEDAP